MSPLIRLAALTLLLTGSVAAGEIREFSIPTLEKLGNELSHRDQIAAQASDVILETQPLARSLKMRGWISDVSKDQDRVYWITDTPSGSSLAYIVTFSNPAKPTVEDARGQPLPPNVALRFKARQVTANALKGKLYADLKYNLEVLDDPDGSGYLVYALGATAEAGKVVMAGHFRVTVDASGEKVERVDPLSKSVSLIDADSDESKETSPVALALFQLVSNKPVETLIYTSGLVKKPIVVQTSDRAIWSVSSGKIELYREPPLKPVTKSTPKK